LKIHRKKLKDGRVVLRWYEPGGGRPQVTCADDADADVYIANLRLDIDSGRMHRRRYRKMTLQDFAVEWLGTNARQTLTQRTLSEYVRQWDKYIEPALGHLTLEELEANPRHIERLKADLMSAGKGAHTVRSVLNVLQRVLRTAVDWNYLDTNPASRVKKPKARRARKVQAFTVEQVEAMRAWMLANKSLEDATLLSILAYGGLRPGEALALTWAHVLPEHLHVEQANSNGELRETKTGVRAFRPAHPTAR
jgi:integrase